MYRIVEIQGIPANQVANKLKVSRESIRQLRNKYSVRLLEISNISDIPIKLIKLIMLGKDIEI